MAFPPPPLPPQVQQALQRGNQIEAIKLLRAATGLGLKEAKQLIDAHVAGQPVSLPATPAADLLPPDVIAALQQGKKIDAIRLLREHTGLGLAEAKQRIDAAPADGRRLALGEMPRSDNRAWLVVLSLAAALLVYWYLTGH